jgi:hypothetical protein
MEKARNIFVVLVGNLEGNRILRSRRRWKEEIILYATLKKQGRRV